jgi:AraC-like DNA-binding protein
MATKRRLGFIGPTRALASPFDQPCSAENARLARAVAEVGPLFFGDMKIQTAILHLTCPPAGSQARYHVHPFLEATCVLAGAMEYRLEGRGIPVRRGEVFIMPPETVHGWSCAARGTVLIGFLMAVSPTADRPGALAYRLAEAAAAAGYRFRPSAELGRAFRALRAEARGEWPYHEAVAAAGVRTIIPLLFRHLADALGLHGAPARAAAAGGESRSGQLFLQAKAFIEANLGLGASLADVARHLGLSPRHLNRIFREREGKAVGQFITAARLERAKQLLRERRDLSVKSAAALCGVSDVAYFCRLFKAATGTTPAAYAGGYPANRRPK